MFGVDLFSDYPPVNRKRVDLCFNQ